MLDIVIKGKTGEGKSQSARCLQDYWEDQGKKVLLIEGWQNCSEAKIDLSTIDVFIKVIQ